MRQRLALFGLQFVVLTCALASSLPAGATPRDPAGDDRASLGLAFEAARHAIVAVEDGHRARNPGQRWSTHFDGRGFLVRPDSGGWSWGLELVRYGWGEQ